MTGAILPLALGVLASVATFVGGTIALRLHGRLSLVLGLSGGIVLGVALLDLIPEALRLSQPASAPSSVFVAAALGMFAYVAAGRLIAALPGSGQKLRGHLAPGSLTLHSFIDGCGIGLAFQLSPAAGWSVAIAILSHDIADGVNIVGLSLASYDRRVARRWLMLNGAAPLIGAAVGQFIVIPRIALVRLLAAMAGAFFCIAASELLPKSYRMNRRLTTILSGLAGFAIIYLGTRLDV